MKTMCNRMCIFLMLCFVLLLPATATHAQQGQTGPPAYSTLADLLENEQTRKALIEDLRTLASKQTQVAEPGQALPVKEPEKLSLPGRMAELVSEVAGDVGSRFTRIAANLRWIMSAKPGTERAIDLGEVARAALNLGLIIIDRKSVV